MLRCHRETALERSLHTFYTDDYRGVVYLQEEEKMKASKFLGVLAFAVVLVLDLNACGGAAPAATNAPAATTASTGGAFTCNDKIGCVDIAPSDPVHIAYSMVTSGPNSDLGLDTKYGAEIAVDDAGGKVLGHDIKFDGQDDQCSAEGGQAAGAKLASDKTIVAIIGTDCSSAATAEVPIISGAGLTIVSPAATAPSLTDPAKHDPAFLRVCYNDKLQGAIAAQFVFNQLKVKTAATIHDGSPYAQQLQQVFADNFKQLGGTITAQEAVNVGDKDMKPVLTRIASGKPQLVYFPIFVAEGSAIASQFRDVPGLEKTIMMGADGIFDPNFVKTAGKNTVGMYWSSPDFSSFGSNYDAFLQKYEKKYNVSSKLGPYDAHAYDAMNVILAAIQKVAVKDPDGTLHIGRQALRDALYATKDFKGLTGSLTCDPNGDCGANIVAVFYETADDFSKGQTPLKAAWKPGGPDYVVPTPAP